MEWLKLVHGAPQSSPVAFRAGDEVRVWYRILEQGKERLGQFEGIVIRCRGPAHARTFTVRRVTYGEGVERVFPMDSKIISRIEVLRRGQVRRSRLYFLRTVIGKTRIASENPAEAERPAGSRAPSGAGAGEPPQPPEPPATSPERAERPATAAPHA